MPKKRKKNRKDRVQEEVNKLERVTHLEDNKTKVENLVKIEGKWQWMMVVFDAQGQIADCNEVFRKMIRIGSQRQQEEKMKQK